MVESVSFQDDIRKPSMGVQEAKTHMFKLSYMFEDKGLQVPAPIRTRLASF